jgi:hypothetical protein
MPAGRYSGKRRTAVQVAADAEADRLAGALGRMLRDARGPDQTQAEVAAPVGLAQTSYSLLERGGGASVSLRVWVRAARGAGVDLHAYLEGTTAADAPRDAVHLRSQELVARTAVGGGWSVAPEVPLDAGPGSRAADLVFRRDREIALMEIVNWMADAGGELRSWERRLARLRMSHPTQTVNGCVVLRATRRNRRLVLEHVTLFGAAFPAELNAWLRALTRRDAAMPATAGLLWISVDGRRLFASRLTRGRR